MGRDDDDDIDIDVSSFADDPSREFPLEHTSYGCHLGAARTWLEAMALQPAEPPPAPLPPRRAARASCHWIAPESPPQTETTPRANAAQSPLRAPTRPSHLRYDQWSSESEVTADLRPVTEVEEIEDLDDLDWLYKLDV